MDYFYTAEVEASADVQKGVIGRFDSASGSYVTEGLGEFEVEAEELGG